MATKPKSHRSRPAQVVEQHRGSSAERGYNSAWRRARRSYLDAHPLCVECKEEGQLVSATVVDHVVPHRGDPALFWDETNWQPMCRRHHNAKTVREDGGFGRPCAKG